MNGATPAISHERAESVGDTLCARWTAIAGEGVAAPFAAGDLRWADLVQAVLRHVREDDRDRANDMGGDVPGNQEQEA